MTLDDNLGPDADAFYSALMAAHSDLTETQSHALNARLVLIFGNEIGSLSRLQTLLEAASLPDTPAA